jgi:hypothetical protein
MSLLTYHNNPFMSITQGQFVTEHQQGNLSLPMRILEGGMGSKVTLRFVFDGRLGE